VPTSQEPYLRTPSIELPLFFGDNALSWISECDGLFALAGITNDNKVKWANAHIRGRAKTWLQSSNLNLYLMNWPQFCELLCERFPSAGEHEAMEAFHLLKQTTTVNQYIDNFEDTMINMRHDHPYLTDHFFLLRFISGLKDYVKHMVKSHQPATLKVAYWHARQQEQAYLSFNKKTPMTFPYNAQTQLYLHATLHSSVNSNPDHQLTEQKTPKNAGIALNHGV
jgi:hypothetical protein